MAAVFDINTGFRSSAVATINAGLETITVAVATLGPTEAVVELERAQQRLAGLKHQVIADHIHSDGNTRDAEKLLANSKASRNTKRRIVQSGQSRRPKRVARRQTGQRRTLRRTTRSHRRRIGEIQRGRSCRRNLDRRYRSSGPRQRPIYQRRLAREPEPPLGGTQTEHDRQRALRRTQSYHFEEDRARRHHSSKATASPSGQSNDAIRRPIQTDLPARRRPRPTRIEAHPRTRAQREYDADLRTHLRRHHPPRRQPHPRARRANTGQQTHRPACPASQSSSDHHPRRIHRQRPCTGRPADRTRRHPRNRYCRRLRRTRRHHRRALFDRQRRTPLARTHAAPRVLSPVPRTRPTRPRLCPVRHPTITMRRTPPNPLERAGQRQNQYQRTCTPVHPVPHQTPRRPPHPLPRPGQPPLENQVSTPPRDSTGTTPTPATAARMTITMRKHRLCT